MYPNVPRMHPNVPECTPTFYPNVPWPFAVRENRFSCGFVWGEALVGGARESVCSLPNRKTRVRCAVNARTLVFCMGGNCSMAIVALVDLSPIGERVSAARPKTRFSFSYWGKNAELARIKWRRKPRLTAAKHVVFISLRLCHVIKHVYIMIAWIIYVFVYGFATVFMFAGLSHTIIASARCGVCWGDPRY